MMASFSFGNMISSKLIPFYPLHKKPKTWDPAIDRRLEEAGWLNAKEWMVSDLDGEVLTRVELDQKMMREAVTKIKEGSPIKFFLAGIAGFLRLNAPMNYSGQEMMDLFLDSHNNLPDAVKIGITLAIRGTWLLFVGIVFFTIIFHAKEWRTWGLLALYILYHNAMYAFLTHAEVRYILMAMPLYFLFFAEGIRLTFSRFLMYKKES